MISVLYVDDEPELLELTKLYLERAGDFVVDTCLSAIDAQKILASSQYDAVIADYQLPVMDGIELLQFVRAHYGDLPFIIFTGKGREEVVIQALDNGADFYVQKGGDPKSQFAELTGKIQKAVEVRNAVAAQKDSEQRMQDIISFLPDATLVIDAKGTVIAWNRAIEEMTGVPAGAMIGKGNYEYALPFYHKRRPILLNLILRDDPVIANLYDSITRQGDKLISEKFVPHFNNGNGAYLWFTASPLYDSHGNVVGAIESVRDITGQKQLERSLRASEVRYHNVFDSAAEAMIVIDRDTGRIFDANKAALRLYGYALDEFRAMHTHALSADAARSVPPDQEGFLYIPERNHRKKDGGIFPVEITGNVYHHKKRTIAIITVRDLTERKKAEEAIRQSEEQYRSLFEHMLEGFALCRMVYDADGQPADWIYLAVNSAFERLTGLKGITGKPVTDAIPGIKEQNPELFGIYDRVIKTGRPETFEIYFKPLSMWMSVAVFSPKQDHFVAVFDDITKRKRAEEQLRQFNEELERSVAERTEALNKSLNERELLLREIHHRVKNNLQIIISLLNLQSRYIRDEKVLGAIRESQNRIRAMAAVHEKLYRSRDISKIHLHDYVRFLATTLLRFFGVNPAQVTYLLEISRIDVDINAASPLGLIINELVSNSLKYAFPDGRKGQVSISGTLSDTAFTLTVADDGVGLPEGFDWKNAESLGLRLVISLVNQLDGTIEHGAGPGTTFIITIPREKLEGGGT